MPGWLALMFGFYWYPSNLALITSPLLSSRSTTVAVRMFLGAVLLLTFVVTIFVLVRAMEDMQVAIGFYVWLSAFAVSGIGLIGSAVQAPAHHPNAKPES
jgi:hypothetical protein